MKHWDKYDFDVFQAARNLPAFRFSEKSWQDKADNIEKAIALLPANLQVEAKTAIQSIGTAGAKEIAGKNPEKEINENGALTIERNGMKIVAGEVAYQTLSSKDFAVFHKNYLRNFRPGVYCWALDGHGKPGLAKTKAQSATLVAKADGAVVGQSGNEKTINTSFLFPAHPGVDRRTLPAQVRSEYIFKNDGSVYLTLFLVKKPAVRLPEVYWLSFYPENIVSILAEKLGYPVDVLDVVEGGNRTMHGIDRYVDVLTNKGAIRITSLDVPVVAFGERNALNFSLNKPTLNGGIHFCLFANLWGVNFTMWWEGSIAYRFKIEMERGCFPASNRSLPAPSSEISEGGD